MILSDATIILKTFLNLVEFDSDRLSTNVKKIDFILYNIRFKDCLRFLNKNNKWS